ncbi:hypothetical protein Tco_1348892, partial [Tanacetum coccineum]
VMEMLNLLIKGEIRMDKSFKYHFGCKQLKITHLFANDLIMLCHGDMNSVETLKRALDKFSSVSDLYPNLSKCTMFCGSLGDDTKDELSSIFPFKEGKLLVRYLGVPLVTMKIGIADCNQLVKKVRQKLSDWKNKSLSINNTIFYLNFSHCGIPESLCDLLPSSMNFSNNLLSGPIPLSFIKGGQLESFT